ncbi:MAG: Hsp33 family molecular chaperone HslO [Myxococcaceae bacterium]|nr:Hsp33 family molecular chaperone HslO [Myxococcaceae bacterium]
MSTDAIVKGLIEATNLSVSLAVVSGVTQEARHRHRLAPVSAALLGRAFAGGSLVASLQKGTSRINLQLECDGPLRGLFVDASPEGALRGYVKNPDVGVELSGAFRWRAALGNSGFLSVLRDIGPEFYRSSVELTAFDLAGDLNHYFSISEQVKTAVALATAPRGDEPLGCVAGVLLQVLPHGDVTAFERLAAQLPSLLDEAVADAALSTPEALWQRLFPGLSVLQKAPARFQCTCSKPRTLEMLASLGKAQVQDIIDTTGSTAVTCHFCATKYEVTFPDLVGILDGLTRGDVKN